MSNQGIANLQVDGFGDYAAIQQIELGAIGTIADDSLCPNGRQTFDAHELFQAGLVHIHPGVVGDCGLGRRMRGEALRVAFLRRAAGCGQGQQEGSGNEPKTLHDGNSALNLC